MGRYRAMAGSCGSAGPITQGAEPALVLDWREEGGPAVAASGREGFGTRLIRSTVALDLRGTVDMSFMPEGLHVRIEAPLLQAAEF